MGSVIFQGFYDDSENREPGDTPDLRLIVVMGSSTCESEEDAATVGDFSDVDELDSFYTRGDPTGVAITYETSTTPNEVRIDFDDDADGFGASVAAGSDDVLGVLLVRNVDGGTGDIPWAFTTEGAVSPSGGTYGWSLPAEGFLYEHQG